MAIDLDKIEKGYAEAMLRKYNYQLERFKDVFDNPKINTGGMHVNIYANRIELVAGFGSSQAHNLTNEDAKHILNIIRMSIEDRIKKFEGNGK